MADQIPDPTATPGAPHPRDTAQLFGQNTPQADFLDAFTTGRLHHAWLITGPRGVGKATLAWRIARFLLATPDPAPDDMFGAPPPTSLDISLDHPIARRIAAGAEPGLKSVHRTANDKGRLRDQIVVDDIRSLGSFFQLSAADGGRRVVIIDAADEMNVNAANALLKMLEEPPAHTTLLLVCHQPSRLLPTIRSRCRTLRLAPLQADAMAHALAQAGVEMQGNALAELSAGSVGAAIRLAELGGLDMYAQIIGLLGSMPRLDRTLALALADAAAARGGEAKLDLFYTLLDIALNRLARTGAAGQPPHTEAAPNEAQILSRLAPHGAQARAWADTAQTALDRARYGRAVNLDPGALVLDTLQKLSATAPST